MKTIPLILFAALFAVAAQAQPTLPPPPMMVPPKMAPTAAPVKNLVNYLVRVEWKDAKDDPKFLEVLTTEGRFDLNTFEKNSVKIGKSDIPVTLKLQGTLTDLNGKQGKLDLFLGRTVPYVTSTYGSGSNKSSSYSQMQVGLSSSFIVTFGKPLVIQNDGNGQVILLVKRVVD